MNIFLLSNAIDPLTHYDEQATYHCDKHIIKMIAESTQMLVTAMTVNNLLPGFSLLQNQHILDRLPCKPLGASMQKHPCTIWASESLTNFNYLACLARALCREHGYRYPLSTSHAYESWLYDLADMLRKDFNVNSSSPLPTHFAVAIKDADKRSTHTPHHEAVKLYRSYYVADKIGFATWKRRGTPVWFMMDSKAKQDKSKPDVYKF